MELALGLAILSIIGFSSSISPAFCIDVDDSSITKYYSLNSIPTPSDENLGEGVFIDAGETNYKNASNQDINGKNVYSSYSINRLYKYPNVACSIIEDLDSTFHDMNPGSSISISYSTTASEEVTYSTQVSNILEANFGAPIKISTGIGILSEEKSVDLNTTFGFTKTDGISNTYTKSSSIGITSTYSVNEKGLYRLTRRGLFDVYIIQKLTQVNDITYYTNNGIRYASSKLSYYTIDSYSYVLSYVNNSMYEGLTKYIKNDDNLFSVDQDYVQTLFPSSNVVCID